MGLLDGLLGNASEVSVEEARETFAPILGANETLEKAFKLVRDMLLFTSHRLIRVDKQGLTGRKVEFHSIPYRAITQFKVETAGHFDMDAELKIWISGQAEPIEQELKKSTATDVQQALASYMFK